jgi:hypothetical protein
MGKKCEFINCDKYASYNTFIPWDLNDPNNCMIKNNITKGICILQDTVNPCSLGYIVTLNGAKNLIEHFETNGFYRATDWNFNMYLIEERVNMVTFIGGNAALMYAT